jgi:hypothetical protein
MAVGTEETVRYPTATFSNALDGNKQNTDPSNWELIPRALLPRLGGRFGRDYDNAPDALKPTIMAVAKLEHAARSKTRSHPDERSSA